jgi:hypothetical protein
MRAVGGPVRKLMRDVKSVKWLPLDQAIGTLTHAHEQAFLANVGPTAIAAAARSARDVPLDAGEQPARDHTGEPPAHSSLVETILSWFRRMMEGRA